MQSRLERLLECVASDDVDDLWTVNCLIETAGQDELGLYIAAMLSLSDVPVNFVDLAISRFVRHFQRSHDEWFKAIKGFLGLLWRRSSYDPLLMHWVRQLYRVVIDVRQPVTHQSSELIRLFEQYAEWCDDPVDFYLTKHDLKWFAAPVGSITLFPFASEVEYLQWRLSEGRYLRQWDPEVKASLVDEERVQSYIDRLADHGVDVSEHDGLIYRMHSEILRTLQGRNLSARSQYALRSSRSSPHKPKLNHEAMVKVSERMRQLRPR